MVQSDNIRILHVDDNKDDLAIFKYHLTSLQKEIEVDWAISGEEALRMLLLKEYDCILSDYEMNPGMNGLDLLIKVKVIKPKIPFIFLTGQGNESVAAEAFHLGAYDYFTKDYAFMIFQRLLNSINQGINGYHHNIERDQMQLSLMESEERYRRLVDLNPKAIVVHLNGEIIYINKTALNILGKKATSEQLIGTSVLELIHPSHREAARRRIIESMAGISKNDSAVYSAVFPGINDVQVEVTSIPITFKGNPAVLSVLDNITERLKAEETNKNLNSLLNAIRNVNQIINMEKEFVTIIEKTTNILANVRNYAEVFFIVFGETNKSLKLVAGCSGKKMLKKLHWESEGKGKYPQCVKKMIETGELIEINKGNKCCTKCEFSKFKDSTNHLLVPFRKKDKLSGFFYITIKEEHKMEDEEINLLKDIVGDLEFCNDKIQAEESLKQSEEKYRIIFDLSPDVMTVSSIKEGKIIDANKAFFEKSGYTREEVIGKTTMDLGIWDSIGDRKRHIEAIEARGYSKDISLTLYGKDKRKYRALLTSYPVEYQGESKLLSVAHDLTEFDDMYSNLRYSEERYRSILDNAHDAIIVSKADGSIIETNQIACDLLGFSSEDFSRLKLQDIKTAEGSIKISEIVKKTKLNEKAKFETILVDSAGKKREVEIRCSIFNYKDESLFQAFINDISAAKKAERRRTKLYRFLGALTDSNYKILKSDSPRSEINKVLEILGEAVDAGRCYWFETLLDGEILNLKLQAEWAQKDLKKRLVDSKGVEINLDASQFNWKDFFGQDRVITGSIETAPSELSKVFEGYDVKSFVMIPIIYEKDFKGILGLDECESEREWYDEEITLLKSVADSFGSALKQEKIKKEYSETSLIMSEFMNSTSDCFEIKSSDGCFVMVNRAAAHIYDTTPEEMIGKSDYDYLSKRTIEIFEKEFNRVLTGKDNREFLFFNSDLPEPRVYHTLLFPLVNPVGGDVLVGVIKRDVTERQKDEEKIKRINKELDEFVHTVCHDLKAPLQSMIGYLDMLRTVEDSKQENVISKALSQGEMMQRFITQLLRISSLGRSIGSILPFDPTLVIKEVFEVFKVNYPNAVLQIKGNLPVINGDINRIREVFQNIISNSLENSDPKKTRPIIVISCNKEDKRYVFSVKDNGKGMDVKTLGRLFVIGYSLSRDGTPHFGLGLNITKRIIEAHGGEIWAESEPELGTNIYFSIPFKKEITIKKV